MSPSLRVSLVWLNAAGPPGVSHGLLVLARELRDAGHDVMVHHLNASLGGPADGPALLAALVAARPEVVGLSFASPDAALARTLARDVRAAFPDVRLLCGGIHTTLDPEGVFAWPEVDAIGLGELDGGPLVALVDALARGERPREVRGFWLRWEGREHRNPMAPLPNLEGQALPLYDGVDLERHVQAKRGFGEVLSGRGCPYRCRFCQNHAVVARYRASLGTPASAWPYVRQRGVEGLLAELRELKARAPSLRAIMFADDRLAGDRQWLLAFAERYRAEIGLPFIVNATADQIDPEVAGVLFRAGCNMVKLGVECAPGDLRQRVLGRPEGEARLRAAFAHLRQAGVNTMAYLMIGIPGETPEALAGTFRFCAALRPDAVRVAMFCPYPGTRLYDELVATGQLGADAGLRGFGEPSALRWAPAMQRLLAEAPRLLPWLLNEHLGEAAEASASLVCWARTAGAAAGADPAASAVLALREGTLWRELRAQGAPHYLTPFPERPDYAFLSAPRRQPLINVDLPTTPEPGADAPGGGTEA